MKYLLKKGIAAMAFAALVLAANGPAQAANYQYSVTDLGLLAQTNLTGSLVTYKMSLAYDINDSGTVVGSVKGVFKDVLGTTKTYNLNHTMTWNGTGVVDLALPLVGGNAGKAEAYGIKSSGQVVGYSTFGGNPHAFLYDTAANYNGGLGTDLAWPAGYAQGTAKAINDAGQIVGYTGNTTGTSAYKTATIYTGGTSKVIPGATVGTSSTSGSSANAINKSGLVTGYSTVSGNAQAFIYDSSTDAFSTLGSLGGSTSYGADVNDSGAVIGYSTLASGVQHAFLYSGGTMIDLGALGGAGNSSQANAINNAGTIVGTSNGHAFMYSNGKMVDLNTLIDPALGITLTSATGINNLGQIVANYVVLNTSGQAYDGSRAFLLTSNPAPVPIPAALPLLGSGLAFLGFIRRKLFRA